jgi:hypothetical protein
MLIVDTNIKIRVCMVSSQSVRVLLAKLAVLINTQTGLEQHLSVLVSAEVNTLSNQVECWKLSLIFFYVSFFNRMTSCLTRFQANISSDLA